MAVMAADPQRRYASQTPQYVGGKDAVQPSAFAASGARGSETHSGMQYGGTDMGKGSRSATPKMPTAMENAQAQDWAAQQQWNREQQQKNADKAAKDAADAAQKTQTQADIGQQYTAGQGYGTSQMKNLGYADTYGIMDRYNTALNQAKSSVPGMATDVGKYFNTSDMWNKAISDATSAQRGKLNTQYGNTFKPGWQQQGQYGFEDTADDAILGAILGEQKTTAQNQLQANLARGTMSQGAYDYALNQLGQQGEAGMSTLQGIGGGVLGGYRGKLGTEADAYSDRITNYALGNNMNINDLTGQLGTMKSGFNTGMRGDILKAMGDTQLFDLSKLVSQAGAATGASNTPLQTAFANTPTTTNLDPNRNTGTTGIF
jgi:hypothetical protein